MVEADLCWDLVQTKDVIDPKHARYNEKARLAKTLQLIRIMSLRFSLIVQSVKMHFAVFAKSWPLQRMLGLF